jgi:hypothetical protein
LALAVEAFLAQSAMPVQTHLQSSVGVSAEQELGHSTAPDRH